MNKLVSHTIDLDIKFSDVDSIGIVWHGHYVRYFEDGREALGRKYGIGYSDFKKQGIIVPIVQISCDYKRMIKYEDKVQLTTTLIDTPAAKLIYEYEIHNKNNGAAIAIGSSTQVFLNKDSFEMMLNLPAYMIEQKNKWMKEAGR
jgi:acyl-CoA thioester hydrolase